MIKSNYLNKVGVCLATPRQRILGALAALGLSAFATPFAHASDLTLAWQPPTTRADQKTPFDPNRDLRTYRLYRGTQPGTFNESSDVGRLPTVTLPGVNPGDYYFAVTAVDQNNNESTYSNVLLVKVPAQSSNDSDRDGTPDPLDCSPKDKSLWRDLAFPDPDSDGIRSSDFLATVECFGNTPPTGFTLNASGHDNCPRLANVDQVDANNNQIGDACEKSFRSFPVLDFDGDGKSDTSFVTKGATAGTFDLKMYSTAVQQLVSMSFQLHTTKFAAADFDGDGSADVAEIRIKGSQLLWAIHSILNSKDTLIPFGNAGDTIIAGGHFDRDAKADLAAISTRAIKILRSSDNKIRKVTALRSATIQKVAYYAADTDGDGIDEILIMTREQPRRAKKGAKKSRRKPALENYLNIVSVIGKRTQKIKITRSRGIIAADIDGDGIADPAVYRLDRGSKMRLDFYLPHSTLPSSISTPRFRDITRAKIAGENGTTKDALVYVTLKNQLVQKELKSGTESVLNPTFGTSTLVKEITVLGTTAPKGKK